MPEKYTYLLVDFFCIIFPFVFSFYPKINFYKQWKYFVIPCLSTALFFIVWDIIFVEKGVWSFNPKYVLGFYLFSLPLEEYLFFICIPYASVFTYYCIRLFFRKIWNQQLAIVISVLLILFLLLAGVTHLAQLYTSVTFLLLAVFLSVLAVRKATFLPPFYVTFLIILIPFFISNGILTGSFIAGPVVRYNNAYNLQIRMFTIPFEDTFYGMLLLLMNVTGFEYLKKRDV